MNSHHSFFVAPPVARSLRRRRVLRRALTIALIATPVLFMTFLAVPATLHSLLLPVTIATLLAMAGLDLYLLHADCPRCGERFAPRSVFNLFMAPAPAAFAGSCAACGVPLDARESSTSE